MIHATLFLQGGSCFDVAIPDNIALAIYQDESPSSFYTVACRRFPDDGGYEDTLDFRAVDVVAIQHDGQKRVEEYF